VFEGKTKLLFLPFNFGEFINLNSMSKVYKVTKGLDIKLEGVADKVYESATPETYALKPTDFHGIFPKLIHREGDEVKAGTPILYDKYNEHARFASPVSGEIVEVKRGAKRKMLEVKILADKELKYEKGDPKDGSREEVIETMSNAGLWPFLKQRPYDVIADAEVTPKSIHISAFDTAPLGADLDFCLHGREKDFQRGLDVLSKLTDGKVHLNVHRIKTTSEVFRNAKGVQINEFEGKHPSGLVGVQINKVDPINKGENVWTIDAQRVAVIGRYFNEGIYDASIIVSLGGSRVEKPRYYKTLMGASIKDMVKDNLTESADDLRFISGNPLVGDAIEKDGFIGYYHNSICVLPEGDSPQFLGWIAPNFDKFSMSRTFFSWMQGGKRYDLNTNTNGEERAFVVTGQYDKVMPMDILPQQLIKSIIVEDVEQMELLGIYEVIPEDFAICEYVCTSKQDLQQIVRKGLDIAKEELG
jgi:Na+-transporting NADH:ubiquinone oxidoreductase subunit A